MTAFWYMVLCCHVDVDRHFRGDRPDDEGSTHFLIAASMRS
jgi:hypothetical protein